ncbi:hypothetical protein [Alkalicoccus urumqiensis]|uniref:Nitroreductase domain-containing protein n=1 Tax=Alkalicoccus urumqiensis TaxID=1548213 RepID=A0A2P6MLC8_ALKUR|nr:hypothetical protein [Alkalicoccus urumqiensis]PRO67073.1 hypothetical protein C6I21_00455 [Alkalicoccus urumqiensis]
MLTKQEEQVMTAMVEKVMLERMVLRCITTEDVPLSVIQTLWEEASAELQPAVRSGVRLLVFRGESRTYLTEPLLSSMYEHVPEAIRTMYDRIPLHAVVVSRSDEQVPVLRALQSMQEAADSCGLAAVIKQNEYRFPAEWYTEAGIDSSEQLLAVVHTGWYPAATQEEKALFFNKDRKEDSR